MPYRSLNADKLIATLERLHTRIDERFPNRGLPRVCAELLEIARNDGRRADLLGRPNLMLRSAMIALVTLLIGSLAYVGISFRPNIVDGEAFHAFQGIEAVINLVVIAAAALWFLLNLETRIRRGKILADLHELRSIAHVIDMHQLTKDPTTGTYDPDCATPSSPVRDMSGFELVRYLDYCAEMLSLTGKLAALYLNTSQDSVIIATVNEIETLAANLTSKVWQKILIQKQVQRTEFSPAESSVRVPNSPNHRLASGQTTANESCSPLHPFAICDEDDESSLD